MKQIDILLHYLIFNCIDQIFMVVIAHTIFIMLTSHTIIFLSNCKLYNKQQNMKFLEL